MFALRKIMPMWVVLSLERLVVVRCLGLGGMGCIGSLGGTVWLLEGGDKARDLLCVDEIHPVQKS